MQPYWTGSNGSRVSTTGTVVVVVVVVDGSVVVDAVVAGVVLVGAASLPPPEHATKGATMKGVATNTHRRPRMPQGYRAVAPTPEPG